MSILYFLKHFGVSVLRLFDDTREEWHAAPRPRPPRALTTTTVPPSAPQLRQVGNRAKKSAVRAKRRRSATSLRGSISTTYTKGANHFIEPGLWTLQKCMFAVSPPTNHSEAQEPRVQIRAALQLLSRVLSPLIVGLGLRVNLKPKSAKAHASQRVSVSHYTESRPTPYAPCRSGTNNSRLMIDTENQRNSIAEAASS